MAIITLQEVSWGLGGAPLLDRISLQIEKGEKVCLLGRNGVGKSSLIRILSGALLPDSGEVRIHSGVTITVLEQEVPRLATGPLFDIVAEGLGAIGHALVQYRRLSAQPHAARDPALVQQLTDLQHQLDAISAWGLPARIDDLLARTGLAPEQKFDTLSAGMKRRALFCRALVQQPDLLLLDEPTNHLDIDTIIWMEAYLARHVKTMLFVSHDRAFVQSTANRILELDRGRLSS